MAASGLSVSRGRVGQVRGALPGWLHPRAWAYAIPGSRDYRLDLLRGFFVFAMVVDHIGGDSALTTLSGNNQFLVSAAEGFVFVSGLLLGIVYGGRVRKLGLRGGLLAVLHRAAFLYVTVVGLTLAFIGLLLVTEVPLWMDRASGLGVAHPLEAVVGALTLHYSYHGSDILLIYVLLVGAAPVVFYLMASGRTAYVLAGSWLLWGLYQVYPEQAQLPWPIANSIFPFSAWQALFYTGLALGYHRARLGALTRFLGRAPVFAALAAASVGLIYLSHLHQAGQLAELGIPGLTPQAFDFLFAKESLGPGRVVAFFVLAAFAQQVVTRLWGPLHSALGWLLLPLGQKSLLAYGTHLFLIGPAHAAYGLLPWAATNEGLADFSVQAGALFLIFVFLRSQPALRSAVGQMVAEARGIARSGRSALASRLSA